MVVGSGVVVDLTGIAMSASIGEAIVNQSDVLKKQKTQCSECVRMCVRVDVCTHAHMCVRVCLLVWV